MNNGTSRESTRSAAGFWVLLPSEAAVSLKACKDWRDAPIAFNKPATFLRYSYLPSLKDETSRAYH